MAETPQSDKPKKRNKVWLITIAVVLVVAAAGVLTYFLVKDSDDTTPAPTEQEEEQLSPEFQTLDDNRRKEIEDKLADAKTPKEKSEVYIDYANLESGENNTEAALDYAQKAVDTDETIDSLGALAFQAKRAGDYELAADSYGRAAELIRQEGGENSEYEYQTYIQMKEDAEQQNGQ